MNFFYQTAVMNFQIRERRAREEARWAGRVAEIREFLREQRARLEQDRPRANNGDNPEEEPPRRVRILGEGIPPMPRLPIQERLRRQGVEDPAQLGFHKSKYIKITLILIDNLIFENP